MSSESEKGIHEIEIFKAFCAALPDVKVTNIAKCMPPQPDLICTFNQQPTYFELARNYPKAFSQQFFDTSNKQGYVMDDGDIISMLKTKLGKTYVVKEPVHLLLYDDLGIALPNKVVVGALKALLSKCKHIQFKNIWYFANGEALKIYSDKS